MPQIPPGYGNLRFQMLDTSNQHEYLCQIGVALEAADPVTVEEDAGQAWNDNMADFVGNEVQEGVCVLQVGTGDPSEPITYGGVIFVPGEATADTAPPNVSLLIRKRTESGGRKNTGRLFIPKPTEGGIDEGGRLSGGQFGAFQTASSQFLEDLQAIDGVTDVVILHTDVDETPTVVTAFEGQQLVASQRRRLRR
jgi:hypothetical protein